MVTPLAYHGMKLSMSKRIIESFPPHDRFADIFCGSASVLLGGKPPVNVEVLSDLNYWVIAALSTIRDDPSELCARLPKIECREDWVQLRDRVRDNSQTSIRAMDAAIMMAAWTCAFDQSPWSGFSPYWAMRWEQRRRNGVIDARIHRASRRLQGVVIEEEDALNQIRTLAQPGTLFFCDPPYMHQRDGGSRQTNYRAYGPYEPDGPEWHELFLEEVAWGLNEGAIFTITTGDDELYKQSLTEMGFHFAAFHGHRHGGGAARHLLWSSATPFERGMLL